MERPPLHEKGPLRTTVEVRDSSDPDHGDTDIFLHAGNSGLNLRFLRYFDEREVWTLDYDPEGHHMAGGDRVKYATVFPKALLELIRWFEDEENWRGILPGPPSVVEGMTNKVMTDYFGKLFGGSLVVYHAEEENDQYWLRLDFQKIATDPGLLARLERLAARADRQNYEMED